MLDSPFFELSSAPYGRINLESLSPCCMGFSSLAPECSTPPIYIIHIESSSSACKKVVMPCSPLCSHLRQSGHTSWVAHAAGPEREASVPKAPELRTTDRGPYSRLTVGQLSNLLLHMEKLYGTIRSMSENSHLRAVSTTGSQRKTEGLFYTAGSETQYPTYRLSTADFTNVKSTRIHTYTKSTRRADALGTAGSQFYG